MPAIQMSIATDQPEVLASVATVEVVPDHVGPALTREEACEMCIEALSTIENAIASIKDAILRYDKLGLTTADLYNDLKDRGWERSKRTLQRYRAELVADGALEKKNNQGQRNDLPQGDNASLTEASDDEVTGDPNDGVRSYQVSYVKALEDREIELKEQNETLTSVNKSLRGAIDQLKTILKENDIEWTYKPSKDS